MVAMGIKINWIDGDECQCGCGQKVTKGKRFISGHNRRFEDKDSDIKRSQTMKGKSKPKGFGEAVSKGVKKLWQDPVFKTRQLQGRSKGDIKRSQAMKKIWMNDCHRKIATKCWDDIQWKENLLHKQRQGRNIRPNKPEKIILDILQILFPNEWKYTFIINGKNPDFVNVNGQKKIIELFGDYWHKGQDPQDRIDVFKSFGWDTLIIWERELKNIADVKIKIMDFVKKRE
jgi:hypothetical protein